MLKHPIRVLIVDDEPAICRALSIALERANYFVRTAQSGDAALALIAEERFDVLLIDLRIPDTRGDVVFELAAAAQPHLRTQTVFMSGDGTERSRRLILACKCPWLHKPFELRELLSFINTVVQVPYDEVHDQSA